MSENKTIEIQVKRQEGPGKPSHWETFKIPYKPNMNVIACLMELQISPVNAEGKTSTPPAWEAACLEEVCGTCSMIVNGRPRQACTALIDKLEQPIRLEPFSKFPIVRDLITDRTRMFDHLKQVKAWINIDGTHDLGPGPKYSQELALSRYKMSECMTCGCCLEACPNYGPQSKFIGPQAINQVRLFNDHPSGEMNASERLEAVMGEGGVNDCGDAQNCVKACPKQIPLTESIATISRDTTRLAFKKLFG
ncbi:MAG: succinate dehydrogenase iron-sulfur subunit [Bdellovibrionales bacterium]|nr:succinate dehydrogenase iron-sulfur subunit [Bdellovibrionales bacterium]